MINIEKHIVLDQQKIINVGIKRKKENSNLLLLLYITTTSTATVHNRLANFSSPKTFYLNSSCKIVREKENELTRKIFINICLTRQVHFILFK